MFPNTKPRIAVTMGDPWGIGPEVIQKALPVLRDKADFMVYGDAHLLRNLKPEEIRSMTRGPYASPKEAGQASWSFLEAAMQDFKQGSQNSWDALVTAPISKAHIQEAGFPFPGHTEYLASQTNCSDFSMMMLGPKLRVSLVTIHEALSQVPALLSQERIVRSIRLTYQVLLEKLSIAKPRVAVCGLNPHAGEQGLLGKEEIKIIAPAVEEAQNLGYPCEGPKVPDAVFHEAYAGKWDAVVCMYHDQALIPFKMLHFEDGVNLTLGLPIIRTSPDHGTAMDIAGKNLAKSDSMQAAITLAIQMCQKKAHETKN